MLRAEHFNTKGLIISIKGNIPHSDWRVDFTKPILGYAYACTPVS